ncbi:hypothetical protein HDU79_005839 [Rhizoclosmatium sp. JEL0117]|nr:hypothetical protein HDU79_005839 [Rhizoclosmatium sp. JEL0117]
MQTDPLLLWQLVIPRISYVGDISRLSQTCRALHSLCAAEMRFSTLFFEAIDQDRLCQANNKPYALVPTSDWTLWYFMLGHVQIAIEAAKETHLLHASSTTTIPFLKLCSYTIYHKMYNQKFIKNGALNTHMVGVSIRLPIDDKPYSGGLVQLSCRYVPQYGVVISCYIPKSTRAGIPTSNPACDDEIETDPSQEALRNLFGGCTMNEDLPTPAAFIMEVFDKSVGFSPSVEHAFESLLSAYNCALTLPALCELLFKEVDMVVDPENQGLYYQCWLPLYYPSVKMVYEHPLAKRALLTKLDLGERLQRRVNEMNRLSIMMGLYESSFPYLGGYSGSDSGSMMSEDYEYLSDDEDDDLLDDVSDNLPARVSPAWYKERGTLEDKERPEIVEVMHGISEAVPVGPWDPQRNISLNVVDDDYMRYRCNSEMEAKSDAVEFDVDNVNDNTSMDIGTETAAEETLMDINEPEYPKFQLSESLALTMFQNMMSSATFLEESFVADLILTPPTKTNLALPVGESGFEKERIEQVLGAEVYIYRDQFEPDRVWKEAKQFLITCAEGTHLLNNATFFKHRQFINLDDFGNGFERSVGYRELILRKHVGVDGYSCFGNCEATHNIFQRMRNQEECDEFEHTYVNWTTLKYGEW